MSIFQQLVFIAALGWASQAYAVSGPPKLPDFEAWSAVYSTAVQDSDGESVDPFLGALSLQNVDLAMPGAGGFDLKVVRAYNSSRVAREHRAENDPFTPKPLGWTMHFGRMLVRNRVCSGPNLYANINYMPLLEMPDGKRRLVWGVSQTGSPAMMTADNWSVICSGNGYLVTSPDGTRYDMQYGQVTGATLCPNPMYPAQECNLSMYVTTRITDKNGNFATIGYQTYVPSLPMQWRAWNEPKITQVSTNDGRSLTYTYQLMGNAEDTRKPYLTSISSNSGQTVNYGYTYVGNLDGNDVYALTSAQDPAGRQWLYQYQIPRALTDPRCNFTIDCPPQPGDLLLKKVTNPWGGVRTFTWVLIANKTKVEGVDTKTSSDGGTWKYTYARAPNVQRVTTLQSPKGQSVFYFRSELLENLGNVPPPWTSGLLLSQSDGSSQTVSQTWKGQPMGDGWASLFDMVTTWGGGPVRPVMTGRTVVRDGATYSTSFSGFDAYGYPATIAETGPSGGLRTTNLTYYRNLPKWIPGEVSDEVVPGVGSVTRTWDANGNLASETRDGVSTSFTRHATGDLWTITRPRGLVSTFTNYYRGTAQNEAHPEGVNLSRIVAARGTVSSETDAEGGTTSFLYDGINRVHFDNSPARQFNDDCLCGKFRDSNSRDSATDRRP